MKGRKTYFVKYGRGEKMLRVCSHIAIYYVCDFQLISAAAKNKSETQIFFPLFFLSEYCARGAFHSFRACNFLWASINPRRFPCRFLFSSSAPLYAAIFVIRLKWSVSVALTTARKHISSFFTMPHKTPRNILLSYFFFAPLSLTHPPSPCSPLSYSIPERRYTLAYYYCHQTYQIDPTANAKREGGKERKGKST